MYQTQNDYSALRHIEMTKYFISYGCKSFITVRIELNNLYAFFLRTSLLIFFEPNLRPLK